MSKDACIHPQQNNNMAEKQVTEKAIIREMDAEELIEYIEHGANDELKNYAKVQLESIINIKNN